MNADDLRFRGLLSYQPFEIAGWVFVLASQVLFLLKLSMGMNGGSSVSHGLLLFLDVLNDLAFPFLLMADFTEILTARSGHWKTLLFNTAGALVLFAVFNVFAYRYLAGGLAAFLTQPDQAVPTLHSLLDRVARYGFIDFNFFVDLLLCSLVMIFLNHDPVRCFRGRSILVFRCFSLLPLGYVAASMFLKLQSARGLVTIPVWAFPLLPVIPPMTFALFISLALYVKIRQIRFMRRGHTREEYRAFASGNLYSWHFAVFMAVMLVVFGLLDLAAVFGFSAAEGVRAPLTLNVLDEEYRETISLSEAVGIGDSVCLIFMAPPILLFSISRKPKHPDLGLVAAVVCIFLIIIMYLEALYEALGSLHLPKVTPRELLESVDSFFNLI